MLLALAFSYIAGTCPDYVVRHIDGREIPYFLTEQSTGCRWTMIGPNQPPDVSFYGPKKSGEIAP